MNISAVCKTGVMLINSTMLNISEYEGDQLYCPTWSRGCTDLRSELGFWIEGVLQTTFAIAGILANTISSLILASKEMRNAFNLLLICLAFLDSCYLVGAILESIRKWFLLASKVHMLLFPHLLYPGQMIVMTASVFMTVAIAMERYVAVHYPLDYNFAMNDESAQYRRAFKYAFPVVTLAITFNIPKFLEAGIRWCEPVTNGYCHDNLTYSSELVPFVYPTELRKRPEYTIYYNNWARIFILGVIPTALLIFFNTKIYQDIRVRRAHMRPQLRSVNDTATAAVTGGAGGGGGTGTTLVNGEATTLIERRESKSVVALNGTSPMSDNGHGGGKTHLSIPSPRRGGTNASCKANGSLGCDKRSSNINRRRMEDNLAMIFMGIVAVFLLCHFPRIFLGVHEMVIANEVLACGKLSSPIEPFPLWSEIVAMFSHILLVLNCCSNAVIYCLLSSKFRVVAVKHYNELIDKWTAFLQRCKNRASSGRLTGQNGFEGDKNKSRKPTKPQQQTNQQTQLSQPSNRHSPTHAMAVNCDSKNNLTVELAPMQSVTVTVTAAANSTLQNSSNQNLENGHGCERLSPCKQVVSASSKDSVKREEAQTSEDQDGSITTQTSQV